MSELICEAPGCTRVIDPTRALLHGAKTCDARCRAAAFRARNGYLPMSAGGPRPVAREGRANGSRSKPSGRQISYRKAVEWFAAYLIDTEDISDTEARYNAEQLIGGLLSDRQRVAR